MDVGDEDDDGEGLRGGSGWDLVMMKMKQKMLMSMKLSVVLRRAVGTTAALMVTYDIVALMTTVEGFDVGKDPDDAGGGDDGDECHDHEALASLELATALFARREPEDAAHIGVAAANKIWDGSQMSDPTEVQGLRAAERYSNKLNGLDPSQVYQPPQEDELEESQETTEEEEPVETALFDASWLDFRSFARHTLCQAAKQALQTRCMVAAKRAFEVLACQAYGLSVPMASFEFLCWLQSTEVCMREEMVFKEKLPEDHDERVQLYLLRNLESRWPFPEELGTYKAIRQRLEAESPFFQRLQLEPLLNLRFEKKAHVKRVHGCSLLRSEEKLPSIEEILLSHLPALTLVVTLQFRSNYIYAGAVLSPDAGDRTERAKQLQPMVARHMVHPAEVQTSINRISSTNSQIEKQLLSSPEVDPQLRENIRTIVEELDEHLMEPLSRRLEGHFWQCGLHASDSGSAVNVVLVVGEH
eukprot:s9273_g1.t1